MLSLVTFCISLVLVQNSTLLFSLLAPKRFFFKYYLDVQYFGYEHIIPEKRLAHIRQLPFYYNKFQKYQETHSHVVSMEYIIFCHNLFYKSGNTENPYQKRNIIMIDRFEFLFLLSQIDIFYFEHRILCNVYHVH